MAAGSFADAPKSKPLMGAYLFEAGPCGNAAAPASPTAGRKLSRSMSVEGCPDGPVGGVACDRSSVSSEPAG
jgi:hypothetical protein